MTTEHVHTDARIDRSAFPDVETLQERCDTDAAYLENLSDLYKKVQEELADYKTTPSSIKDKVTNLVGEVKDDVRDLFEEEGNFRDAALGISEMLTSLIKGSAEELVRVKEGGDDLVFLMERLNQYRNALLTFVLLEDPIDHQTDIVGRAALVYEDTDGQAYTCRVNARTPVADLVRDPSTPKIQSSTLPPRRDLLNMIHSMYEGAEGILDRSNVFFVNAPEGVGLKPRQVLGKAISLYRKRYNDADEELIPPANDEREDT